MAAAQHDDARRSDGTSDMRACGFSADVKAAVAQKAGHLPQGGLSGEIHASGQVRSQLAATPSVIRPAQQEEPVGPHSRQRGCIVRVNPDLMLRTREQRNGGCRFTPVLLNHGGSDPLIPAEALYLTAATLGAYGVRVEWHISPGLGHGIDDAGLSHAASFLTLAFAGRLKASGEASCSLR